MSSRLSAAHGEISRQARDDTRAHVISSKVERSAEGTLARMSFRACREISEISTKAPLRFKNSPPKIFCARTGEICANN